MQEELEMIVVAVALRVPLKSFAINVERGDVLVERMIVWKKVPIFYAPPRTLTRLESFVAADTAKRHHRPFSSVTWPRNFHHCIDFRDPKRFSLSLFFTQVCKNPRTIFHSQFFLMIFRFHALSTLFFVWKWKKKWKERKKNFFKFSTLNNFRFFLIVLLYVFTFVWQQNFHSENAQILLSFATKNSTAKRKFLLSIFFLASLFFLLFIF